MFDDLTRAAQAGLARRFGAHEYAVDWRFTRDVSRGDISTAVALKLAKSMGESPQGVAQTIIDALSDAPGVDRVELAGSGYVNVWLKPAALSQALTFASSTWVPTKPDPNARPVIIEGSDPNIAKPLGIHHILPTAIGQCLVNLYRHAGYPVIAWNYIGDWGTQFGNLSVAVAKWGSGKPAKDYSLDELLALYVKFHQEAEQDSALEEEGRQAFRLLEQGDPQLHAFWEDVVAITKRALVPIYDRLHVAFDTDLGESFYNDKMQPVIDEGLQKKVISEGERGSLIVEFPEETGMPPFLIRKADGATLYSTRDLAQMRYRIDTFHPQIILIPTDISQKLHFEQLEATCRMLGWELPFFENILFGRMRFVDKAMSTRKGNILKLEEVLEEAVERARKVIEAHRANIQTDDEEALAEMMGIGALVYGILSQNRKMDIVFDWDKMLSFEGNSAPYLQYTYARARSVLRKAEVSDASASAPASVEELTDAERLLIQSILSFSDALEDARTSHMPHKLATALYQLSQDYNAFYNVEPILKAAEPKRQFRLFLSSCTANVLRTGAELLTLRVPERM